MAIQTKDLSILNWVTPETYNRLKKGTYERKDRNFRIKEFNRLVRRGASIVGIARAFGYAPNTVSNELKKSKPTAKGKLSMYEVDWHHNFEIPPAVKLMIEGHCEKHFVKLSKLYKSSARSHAVIRARRDIVGSLYKVFGMNKVEIMKITLLSRQQVKAYLELHHKVFDKNI